MRVLLDDQADGSQFPVDVDGATGVGSILVTYGKDRIDLRVYVVTAINGQTFTVERKTISVGVYA